MYKSQVHTLRKRLTGRDGQAVHRSTIAALVSSRYNSALTRGHSRAAVPNVQGACTSPTAAAHLSDPAALPSDQDEELGGIRLAGGGGGDGAGEAGMMRTEDPLVQGQAHDFGCDQEEEEEAPVGALVPLVTALGCLLTVLQRHGGALAKGSALLGGLEVARALQLFLETNGGARGHAIVSGMVRRCPVIVHSVYVTPHAFVLLVQGAEAQSFLHAAKRAFKLFTRVPESRVVSHFTSAAVFSAATALAGVAGVLSVLHAVAGAGQSLHCVTAAVAGLLTTSIFGHVTSLARHAAVAAEVCYVQDVEKCRPCPPGRCCSALHNAVVACWELAPAEHSPDSSQVYSVSREAAHSSDDV